MHLHVVLSFIAHLRVSTRIFQAGNWPIPVLTLACCRRVMRQSLLVGRIAFLILGDSLSQSPKLIQVGHIAFLILGDSLSQSPKLIQGTQYVPLQGQVCHIAFLTLGDSLSQSPKPRYTRRPTSRASWCRFGSSWSGNKHARLPSVATRREAGATDRLSR